MALYRSFFTVGFLTILSRLVGFLREILIARELGANAVTDAIKVAIKLPSLFRRIFAEGAFNASFVPMFAELLNSPDNKKEAISFAEMILSWLCVMLCLLTIIVEIGMPYIFQITCPGFTGERLRLVIEFSRITFPFIFFISLTAFYSGILNSLEKFVSVASSPVIGNIFIVAFVMTTSLLNNNTALNFTIAVLGCGIVQWVWVLLPCMKEGYSLSLRRPRLTPRVKVFFKKVGPAALGAGIVQVNIFIDMIIASQLPSGYISYLDFAERLNQLPLSVIGTAISTVLLPLMSRQVSQNKIKDALQTQNESIEFAMLLTIPSVVGLMIWAVPIVSMIYQYGKFTYSDTIATASALHAFAIGLPAYVLIKIFASTFFSHKDTKTPVITAIICVVLNLILNLMLIKSMKHVGLALATAISAWVNAITLGYILHRRSLFVFSAALRQFFYKLAFSIVIGLPFIFLLRNVLKLYVHSSAWYKGIIISGACLLGIAIFAATAVMTGALNRGQFKKNMKIN